MSKTFNPQAEAGQCKVSLEMIKILLKGAEEIKVVFFFPDDTEAFATNSFYELAKAYSAIEKALERGIIAVITYKHYQVDVIPNTSI